MVSAVRRWLRGVLAAASAVVTLAAVLLVPAAPAHAAKAAAPAGLRAMWLWSQADPAAVVNWATANGVKEIFAYVAPGPIPSAELSRLTALRSRAAKAGIRLAALGAEQRWIDDPASAVAWQRTVLATGLFYASHVDVEPYLLPTWNTNRAGVVSRYLKLLATLQAADPRPLEADVPFWCSQIAAGTGNLADAVLSQVSAVTVMTYRDTATGPNSIMGVGADMLARGVAKGRPVRLAAETQYLSDCPYCTFFEEGGAKMRSTLGVVDTAARAYSSFAGIAVHHYTSWRVLAP